MVVPRVDRAHVRAQEAGSALGFVDGRYAVFGERFDGGWVGACDFADGDAHGHWRGFLGSSVVGEGRRV